MSLVLFGPPGSGKGTQSAYLVEQLKMTQLSTGDLFRAEIKNGTELGKKAKTYIDKGALVPDSLTIEMVKGVILSLHGKSFILDGFPRNVAQAEALDKLFGEIKVRVSQAVFLEVPREVLIERLTGRRTCKTCGAVFHLTSKPSKIEGICDVCGGSLIQRSDDTKEVIENRLKTYETNTYPLKDFYKKQGKYFEINGVGKAEEIFERIKSAVKRTH